MLTTYIGRVFVLFVCIVMVLFDGRAADVSTADAGFQSLSTTAVRVSEQVDNRGVSSHSNGGGPGQNHVIDSNQGSNTVDTTVLQDITDVHAGINPGTLGINPQISQTHGTQQVPPNADSNQNTNDLQTPRATTEDAATSNTIAALQANVNSNTESTPTTTKTNPTPTIIAIETSDNIVYAQTNTNQQSTGSTTGPVSDTTVVPDTDLNALSGTTAPPRDDVTVTDEQAPPTGTSADVDPLGIFVDGIKYQRFPEPMPLKTFKSKVLNKSLKKLYILEENVYRLFQNVRQVAVFYQLVNETLYATLQFRSIHYRQCRVVNNFQLGSLGKDKSVAVFEKSLPNNAMERVFFFSENPDEYVYMMSCTDMNASPYACRDTYYLTLDTTRDPPNQFPWLQASLELQGKMNITFDDPRFMFNLVMMPCLKMIAPPEN